MTPLPTNPWRASLCPRSHRGRRGPGRRQHPTATHAPKVSLRFGNRLLKGRIQHAGMQEGPEAMAPSAAGCARRVAWGEWASVPARATVAASMLIDGNLRPAPLRMSPQGQRTDPCGSTIAKRTTATQGILREGDEESIDANRRSAVELDIGFA